MGFWGRLAERISPEGIPWPASVFYDAFSRGAMVQAHYELIVEDIARLREDGALLDVGTGPARLLIRLYGRCPAMRLAGLDISSAMVGRARKNVSTSAAAGHVDLHVGSAYRLPFPDSSFDLVVSSASAHHWKDALGAFNEFHRVLRQGGRALIYDLVSALPPEARCWAVERYGKIRGDLLWRPRCIANHFYSADELVALARSSRFGEGRASFVGMLCRLELIKP